MFRTSKQNAVIPTKTEQGIAKSTGGKNYANVAPRSDNYQFPPRLLIIWGQK
jgi:hypothetical protein